MSRCAFAAGRLLLDWWHVLPVERMEYSAGHDRYGVNTKGFYDGAYLRDGQVHLKRAAWWSWDKSCPGTLALDVPEGYDLCTALAWLVWRGELGAGHGIEAADGTPLIRHDVNTAGGGALATLAANYAPDPRNLRDAFERGAL